MALQQRSVLDRLSRFRRRRRVQNAATLGLVLIGPILTLLTFMALGPLDMGAASPALRLILLADLVYVLVTSDNPGSFDFYEFEEYGVSAAYTEISMTTTLL